MSNNSFKVVIPIAPVPASRPRVTRWSTFYSKTYTQFKKDVDDYFLEHPLEGSKYPLKGLFKVDMVYHIKMPNMSSKKADLIDGTWCDKNIDIDNLHKAAWDNILNNRYIEDDRYIVESSGKKLWSKEPRIEMCITFLEPVETSVDN